MSRQLPLTAWAWALCVVALCAGACKSNTPREGKRAATARARPPYDVRPLLELVRHAERAPAARQLGLRTLGQLPLYDIRLELQPRAARLHGTLRLHYANRTSRPLSTLPLLLHPNAPRELGAAAGAAELTVQRARTIRGPAVAAVEQVRPTLARLRLKQPLSPRAWIELELTFKARLRRLPADSNDIFSQALTSLGIGAGVGTSDYGLLATGDGLTTVASAFPVVAPVNAAGFDLSPPTAFGDLAYSAPYNARIQVALPPGYDLVSNLVDRRLPSKGRDKTVRFSCRGAAVRDLVLVAGRGLRRHSRMLGPTRITSVSLARDAETARRLLDTAARSLELYQQRFGPYPFTELDVVQSTLVGGAGGVEFPGMVLVAGMLYRPPSRSQNPLAAISRLLGRLGNLLGGVGRGLPGLSATDRMDQVLQQMGRFVVAHEVAHQYFAGLVGSDCRQHPAVDEPLAQFAAAEFLRHTLPPGAAKQQIAMNVFANYGVYRMLGGADAPAAQPVDHFPSVLAYAALVYGKAPAYYDALQAKLGPARFRRALRQAIDDNRFRTVTLEQWIAALERGADGASEVRRLAQRHFYGTHGDEDLQMGPSGERVLELMLGPDQARELRQALGALGLRPATLFRMLMSNMLAPARRGATADPSAP